MLEYKIEAFSEGNKAKAKANKTKIYFDIGDKRDVELPNAVEILLTSLSACLLKNITKFAKKLRIDYSTVDISIRGVRKENPPIVDEISYKIIICTEAEQNRLDKLHKFIIEYGTITNTLSKACNLSGSIIKKQ